MKSFNGYTKMDYSEWISEKNPCWEIMRIILRETAPYGTTVFC